MFSPTNRDELDAGVKECKSNGDYSTGTHGPIGNWDVSNVEDMHQMFNVFLH